MRTISKDHECSDNLFFYQGQGALTFTQLLSCGNRRGFKFVFCVTSRPQRRCGLLKKEEEKIMDVFMLLHVHRDAADY